MFIQSIRFRRDRPIMISRDIHPQILRSNSMRSWLKTSISDVIYRPMFTREKLESLQYSVKLFVWIFLKFGGFLSLVHNANLVEIKQIVEHSIVGKLSLSVLWFASTASDNTLANTSVYLKRTMIETVRFWYRPFTNVNIWKIYSK